VSDTNPNNPPATPTVEQLTAQLAAMRSGIAKSLGLEESATDEALLARAQEVAKERDASRAEASALKSAVDAGKVDTALREAFAKSGATKGVYEDFYNLAAPHFHVDPSTGKVVTKPDAPTPNLDPATYCVVELRQRRPGWWELSAGAGLAGRNMGFNPHHGGAYGDECFRPGPSFNFTKQLAFEAKFGPAAADAARAKYRGGGR
jgi:hypothetical protein